MTPDSLTIRALSSLFPRLNDFNRLILREANRNTLASHFLDTVQSAVFGSVEPLIADSLASSLLASWVLGTAKVAKPAPKWQLPPAPLRTMGGEPTLARYPQLERSLTALREKRIVDPATYKALSAEAKQTAFTIARAGSLQAVEKIRDAIVTDLHEGGSLRDFRARIASAIEGSQISPAHVETIYRTQVGQAYAVGQLAALQHPVIGSAFPYLMWSATHDSRTRPDHLAMERHGQNGTAVYRSDDPMWVTLFPPAAWNCRCIAIHLSVRDAARHGSLEAKEWLATGKRPTTPQFARLPYPLILPKNWPTHDRIQPIAA